MENKKLTISVVGVGNMGAAIVRGLIDASVTTPDNIMIFDVDSEKMSVLEAELGVRIADSLEKAIWHDDQVILVAVKPQLIDGVLDSLADQIQGNVLIISIAAGISTEYLLDRLGKDKRVIRAMPNAAAMIGQSATALCKGGASDDNDLETATRLFSAIGSAVVVDERNMNAVTALSGSGPGYLFVIMEAMTDAGVLLGLSREVSRRLTIQTFFGSATLAADGKSFSELKDMITSPGGTTISGLKVMETAGIRGILMETVAAAASRADELSRQ
ncbi:MAG: pyrroline-5-carboxylate reductase [Deltaproteobacteria bacterium]|nr:pyrroline-5-carboxylate reductase [Deltaproteobacteria bacterium]